LSRRFSDDVTDPREILAARGLRAKKSWGQNFLIDPDVHERIVKAVGATEADTVVEIGAGLGTLTESLRKVGAAAPRRVVAIEREPDMLETLRAAYGAAPDVTILGADAVHVDYAALAAEAGRPLLVAGNLPYQISSPLLFALLRAGGAVGRAIVMVQREFAERAVAPPGDKTYGRLSVMLQQAAEVKILLHVPPRAFAPQPRVMSSVMRVSPRATPRVPADSVDAFAILVRVAFSARRKTLRRSLGSAFGDDAVDAAFAALSFDGQRRPETLSVEEFGRLASTLAPVIRARGDAVAGASVDGREDSEDDHA
jgi:16S rRNA (adenine1518-N6/adenine1519-N6)-dimethyltransferase